MPSDGPIKIDLNAVLKSRLGSRAKWVPNFFVKWLERLVHQDEMNQMLEEIYPSRDSEFCEKVLSHLEINLKIEGIENMPPSHHKKVIFASNHPLGGLDGMALIKFVADYYQTEPLFIINDLLMAVEPLTNVFVPVNKHGSQSRETIRAIDEAMNSDRPILIFPAGMCSRRRNGEIRDLEWQKMFVQKARQWKRDIVPLRFVGHNSDNFYKWAARREKLGIKFNAEMILLPSEIFKSRGKSFKIIVGKIIPFSSLSTDCRTEILKIRKIVDSLS